MSRERFKSLKSPKPGDEYDYFTVRGHEVRRIVSSSVLKDRVTWEGTHHKAGPVSQTWKNWYRGFNIHANSPREFARKYRTQIDDRKTCQN